MEFLVSSPLIDPARVDQALPLSLPQTISGLESPLRAVRFGLIVLQKWVLPGCASTRNLYPESLSGPSAAFSGPTCRADIALATHYKTPIAPPAATQRSK